MAKTFRQQPDGSPQEWHRRSRFLPHRDREGLQQVLTFRLYDSVPAAKLKVLEAELQNTCKTDRVFMHMKRARVEQLLNNGYGCCAFSEPHVAARMEEALRHHDSLRYELIAWCIMPNHVHVLIKQIESLSKIVQSWKSYVGRWAISQNECLNLGIQNNRFWMRDYWDRYIRDDEHFQSAVEYIHNNPVMAKLCERPEDWPWSSAERSPDLDIREDSAPYMYADGVF